MPPYPRVRPSPTALTYPEACKLMGVVKDTFKAWRDKYPDFPKPLSGDPRFLWWEPKALREWAAKHGVPIHGK